MIQLVSAGKTDVGKTRSVNEDSYLVDEDIGLFIVSDGVGGKEFGEKASRMTVDIVGEHVKRFLQDKNAVFLGGYDSRFSSRSNYLLSAIRVANSVVYESSKEMSNKTGMSATIVAAMIGKHEISVAHLGDSRLYRYHAGVLELVTRDHSFVNEQIRMGLLTSDEAKNSPYKNVILRAVGSEATADIEIDEIPVGSGDYVLLCSDGLTGMVADSEISDTISKIKEPVAIVEKLIESANGNGGKDNITVIVIKLFCRNSSIYSKIKTIVNGFYGRLKNIWKKCRLVK